MSRSPIQRFISELRRRHVPQTAAIYLVAAWAAIEFADVVVPNLNGPQWVVTAVIVAALMGLPAMLVVAWVFEWGPGGVHRTEAEGSGAGVGAGRYAAGVGPGTTRSQLWLAAVAVLVVGIASAVAVTFVLQGTGQGEPAAPALDTVGTTRVTSGPDEAEPGRPPGVPDVAVPELGELGIGLADSIRNQLIQTLGVLDSVDFRQLAELGRAAAAETGLGIIISRPEPWRVGGPAVTPAVPVPLADGDTLVVEGVAVDTAGVVLVTVDGRPVAEADPPTAALRFSTSLVGRGSAGTRTVVITVQTARGREVRREYQIIQLPGGTP
jgi:hypothetical protein